jgi:hypothetical protein
VSETERPPDGEISIDLKDNVLAAFLAWLVPGLGHLYQGRLFKAALFFLMIMGLFVFGLYLGSGEGVGWARDVYFSWREDRDPNGYVRDEDKRLFYLAQVGVGLPALPAVVQAIRVHNGKPPLFDVFMAPPRLDTDQVHQPSQPSLSDLNKCLHRYFDLGTVYTVIAGLLNVLAIYDAWGGPVILVAEEEESEPDGEQKDPAPQGDADRKKS